MTERSRSRTVVISGLVAVAVASSVLVSQLPSALDRDRRAAALREDRAAAAAVTGQAELLEHWGSLVSMALSDQLRRNESLTDRLATQRARLAELTHSTRRRSG